MDDERERIQPFIHRTKIQIPRREVQNNSENFKYLFYFIIITAKENAVEMQGSIRKKVYKIMESISALKNYVITWLSVRPREACGRRCPLRMKSQR
jgi:hypothetical protein